MTVVTLELTRKLPEGLRNVIANHLALPRWNETCNFYNCMSERERLSLCFHAQLTEKEFNQPYWYLNDESCLWREKLFRALRELLSLFKQPPTVLTAVKPEQYIH